MFSSDVSFGFAKCSSAPVYCSCRWEVGAAYSDKRKMKKHFRILLGVGSPKKSSAPYAL
jgi:hypothetical protein